MYTKLQLLRKYLHYYFHSSNPKGHGIHSPFMFDFITKVMGDKTPDACFEKIEAVRKQLLIDDTIIEVQDFGAGSSLTRSKQRAIRDIAGSALKQKKFGQLLFRMVRHYQPATIVELGTSLGITSSYLAFANPLANVYTCEGSQSIAGIAKKTFDQLQVKNIEIIEGDFETTLVPLLSRIQKIDFAFIDGNHRKEPTIRYFGSLLACATASAIMVFDDIHWSDEMEEAWEEIKQHPSITATVDLFFLGIIFMNTDFKARQHFSIPY